MMLRVEGLEARYGRAQILYGVGFEVAAGEVTSVADVPDMGWVALAMVRREVPDGASVDVAGTTGRVLPAP
jgi:ABC-type polar amino acid transport system ATPase subunit